MWKNISYENCLSYISRCAAAEAYKTGRPSESRPYPGYWSEDKIHPFSNPSVTISRMCGSGGRSVASELATYLQLRTATSHRWTIFDKNLIEKVLEEHHLSRRIAEFVPEDSKSILREAIENWRGLHPPTPTIVKQTTETIWNLAASGYVILVGRAANAVTEQLPNAFHVRLVGPLENRIKRVEEVYEMGRAEAQKYIRSQDSAKRRYMKEYYGRDIDNPLLYHMIINTGDISYDQAARLIGDAVITAANKASAQIAAAA